MTASVTAAIASATHPAPRIPGHPRWPLRRSSHTSPAPVATIITTAKLNSSSVMMLLVRMGSAEHSVPMHPRGSNACGAVDRGGSSVLRSLSPG